MRRTMLLTVALVLGLFSAVMPVVAEDSRPLGRVFVDGVTADVADGELLRVLAAPAIVHLDNGRVLRIDVNSTVRFDVTETPGHVRMVVLSGRVTATGRHGQVLRAGAGSRAVLEPGRRDPTEDEATLDRHAGPERAESRRARAGLRRD